MISKFFTFAHYILKKLISPKPNIHRDICIVKLDALGDMVIFLDFLFTVAESSDNDNVTLILNEKNLPLFNLISYPKNLILIPIKTECFTSSYKEQLSFFKTISNYNFRKVYSPSLSRTFLNDILVFSLCSNEKIGFISDNLNQKKILSFFCDYFYTHLISDLEKYKFEYNRNKYFFDKVGYSTILSTNDSFLKTEPQIHQNQVLIFIGSSSEKRKWCMKNFAEVSNFLHNTYKVNIILAGAKEDLDNSLKFEKAFKGSLTNMVGKTSLNELINLISSSKLVISNETSIPHFCVKTNVPVLVVSNGNHFFRFNPYPEYLTQNYRVTYPSTIDFSSLEDNLKNYYYGSNLDINLISSSKVISDLVKFINDRGLLK